MLRRNECRLNFKNRPVRTVDLKGSPKQPPLPLIGLARSLPLIGLILNKIECYYCIPLQYLEYVVAWVELFGKSWWGKVTCQLMVILRKPDKQEFKCKNVFESDSFASLRWKITFLKPENGQVWHKLVGWSTKLVEQTWKLVGQSPHQLYRKLSPCVVLLSRTASPSAAVIAVTVKIQIGRMTVIGQGDGEEVVWRRF